MGKCSITKKVLDNSIIFPEVTKLVSEGRKVSIRAKGNSMLPFIKDGDTVGLVKIDKVQHLDIILVFTDKGHYVLHRAIKIDGDNITLMGDGNLRGCEYCTLESVLAVAETVTSNGRIFDLRDEKHLRKARLWIRMLPIRRYLLAIYKLFIKSCK